jgi:N-acetylmuramoyl-L-alanine amidase
VGLLPLRHADHIFPHGSPAADSIQHELVRRLGLPDAGLHPRSIAILRETRMPAVRIEPAVAIDRDDATRIVEPNFGRDVALAIANGVVAVLAPAVADLLGAEMGESRSRSTG